MDKKEQLPVPVAPSRGARQGVRQDVDRGKAGTVSYNPVGTGAAWSHNFLNQKPWHPMNFRNQVRKYEAEVAAVQAFKERERALAEWTAEQERVATLGMLDQQEAKWQRDRSQISFMYSKPPGLEAALSRDRELEAKKAQQEAAAAAAAAAADGSNAAAAAGSSQQQLAGAPGDAQQQQRGQQQKQQQNAAAEEAMRQRQMDLDKMREDPFAAILAARSALQSSDKFVLKAVDGVYGGSLPDAGNQMLLGEEQQEQQVAGGAAAAAEIDEAEALLASLDPDERAAVLAALARKKRKAEKAARLEQAEELLRSAGIDPATLAAAGGGGGGGSSSKHKRHRSSSKHKHKSKERKSASKRHKKEKSSKHDRREGRSSRRGRSRSRSDSSSGSDSD